MSTATTTDWQQFSDKTFQKWVDRLSAADFKHLVNTSDQFRARLEGGPAWDSTPNIRDARPATINPKSELGQMIQADKEEADKPLNDAIEAFKERAKADAIVKRDKLKKRLDASAGLTSDLIKYFLNGEHFKNLPYVSAAGSPSFSREDKLEIQKAYKTFCEGVKREFTQTELSALLQTLTDIGGLGQALSPMHAGCWHAAFVCARTIGRIPYDAAPPAEPIEEPKVNLRIGAPTAADKRRARNNDIVFEHKGKKYTLADIDACLGDEYAALVKAGYSTDGEILRSTDQLRKGRTR